MGPALPAARGALASVGDDVGEQIALRAFELVLLREIGLLPELDRVTATQAPLEPGAEYQLAGDRGVVMADPSLPAARMPGADLAAIRALCRSTGE